MNRYTLTCLSVLVCFYFTNAQQIPLFTQYENNFGVINPAAIPSDFFTHHNTGSFGLSFRRQWVDIPNPPTTQVLHGEYFAADRTGVAPLFGGYILNDQTGPTGLTGIYGRIAGVVTGDAEYSGLSIGLSAGAVQYRVKTSDLKLHDANDITASTDRTQMMPDISLGIFYYRRMDGLIDNDYFFTGISVPQFFSFDFTLPRSNGTLNIIRTPHYYATIGWYHFLDNDSYLEPTAWVRYVPNAPVSVDINLRYNIGGTFYVGTGASTSGTVHAETGLFLGKGNGWANNFKLGYSFDMPLQTYGAYTGTSHEFHVGYSF